MMMSDNESIIFDGPPTPSNKVNVGGAPPVGGGGPVAVAAAAAGRKSPQMLKPPLHTGSGSSPNGPPQQPLSSSKRIVAAAGPRKTAGGNSTLPSLHTEDFSDNESLALVVDDFSAGATEGAGGGGALRRSGSMMSNGSIQFLDEGTLKSLSGGQKNIPGANRSITGGGVENENESFAFSIVDTSLPPPAPAAGAGAAAAAVPPLPLPVPPARSPVVLRKAVKKPPSIFGDHDSLQLEVLDEEVLDAGPEDKNITASAITTATHSHSPPPVGMPKKIPPTTNPNSLIRSPAKPPSLPFNEEDPMVEEETFRFLDDEDRSIQLFGDNSSIAFMPGDDIPSSAASPLTQSQSQQLGPSNAGPDGKKTVISVRLRGNASQTSNPRRGVVPPSGGGGHLIPLTAAEREKTSPRQVLHGSSQRDMAAPSTTAAAAAVAAAAAPASKARAEADPGEQVSRRTATDAAPPRDTAGAKAVAKPDEDEDSDEEEELLDLQERHSDELPDFHHWVHHHLEDQASENEFYRMEYERVASSKFGSGSSPNHQKKKHPSSSSPKSNSGGDDGGGQKTRAEEWNRSSRQEEDEEEEEEEGTAAAGRGNQKKKRKPSVVSFEHPQGKLIKNRKKGGHTETGPLRTREVNHHHHHQTSAAGGAEDKPKRGFSTTGNPNHNNNLQKSSREQAAAAASKGNTPSSSHQRWKDIWRTTLSNGPPSPDTIQQHPHHRVDELEAAARSTAEWRLFNEQQRHEVARLQRFIIEARGQEEWALMAARREAAAAATTPGGNNNSTSSIAAMETARRRFQQQQQPPQKQNGSTGYSPLLKRSGQGGGSSGGATPTPLRSSTVETATPAAAAAAAASVSRYGVSGVSGGYGTTRNRGGGSSSALAAPAAPAPAAGGHHLFSSSPPLLRATSKRRQHGKTGPEGHPHPHAKVVIVDDDHHSDEGFGGAAPDLGALLLAHHHSEQQQQKRRAGSAGVRKQSPGGMSKAPPPPPGVVSQGSSSSGRGGDIAPFAAAAAEIAALVGVLWPPSSGVSNTLHFLNGTRLTPEQTERFYIAVRAQAATAANNNNDGGRFWRAMTAPAATTTTTKASGRSAPAAPRAPLSRSRVLREVFDLMDMSHRGMIPMGSIGAVKLVLETELAAIDEELKVGGRCFGLPPAWFHEKTKATTPISTRLQGNQQEEGARHSSPSARVASLLGPSTAGSQAYLEGWRRLVSHVESFYAAYRERHHIWGRPLGNANIKPAALDVNADDEEEVTAVRIEGEAGSHHRRDNSNNNRKDASDVFQSKEWNDLLPTLWQEFTLLRRRAILLSMAVNVVLPLCLSTRLGDVDFATMSMLVLMAADGKHAHTQSALSGSAEGHLWRDVLQSYFDVLCDVPGGHRLAENKKKKKKVTVA